eukprot:m.260999 g.260999  ORF g.260999 m.260999 type:complete len:985 (-) comp15994_c0_seq2:1337-4291(-)
MGVDGGLKMMNSYMRMVALRRSIRKHDALLHDASHMIHTILFRNYAPIMIDDDWTQWDADVLSQLQSWRDNLLPEDSEQTHNVMYVDGVRLYAKVENSIRKKARDDAGLTEDGEDVLELHKRLQKAVHGRSIDAVPHFIRICRTLGIQVRVSATEADAQIVYDLRKQPWVWGRGPRTTGHVVTYDSDLAFFGAESVLFVKGGKPSSQCQYYHQSYLAQKPFAHTNDCPEHFEGTIKTYEFLALAVLFTAAPNDFNRGFFPKIGIKTAMNAVTSVLKQHAKTAEEKEWEPSDVTPLLPHLADALCSLQRKKESSLRSDCQAKFKAHYSGVLPSLIGTDRPVLCVLEIACCMSNCMAVFDDSKGIVNAIEPALMKFQTLDPADIRILTGMAHFDHFTDQNVKLYAKGVYDFRKLTPPQPWVIDVSLEADDLEEASCSAQEATMVTEPDPFRAGQKEAATDDEIPEDIDSWQLSKLKGWLKERGQTSSGNKADLLDRVKQMIEDGFEKCDPELIRKTNAERYMRDNEAWGLVQTTTSDVSSLVNEVNNTTYLPTLQAKLIKMAVGEGDTKRNQSVGATRHVEALRFRTLGPSSQHHGESALWTQKCHVTGVVSRSYPGTLGSTNRDKKSHQDGIGHLGRVVSMTFHRVTDGPDGGIVADTPNVCCLVPLKSLDHENKSIKFIKGWRPCRAAGGVCVHARALMEHYARTAARPGVGEKCRWNQRAKQSSRYEKDDFAANLPVQGHPEHVRQKAKAKSSGDTFSDGESASDDETSTRTRSTTGDYRRTFNPFTQSQLAEIDKGVHTDGVYHDAALKLAEVIKAKEIARSRNSRVNMKDRKLKFELILFREADCTCKWLPGCNRWESRCAPCMTIKAAYCYDRGLTKVHIFHKHGIRCFTPVRKSDQQMVWSAECTSADRGLASERTTVERNNRELRCFAGFDAQITPSEISLTHSEGFAAAGLCNLKPCLTNWAQLTETQLLDSKSKTQ